MRGERRENGRNETYRALRTQKPRRVLGTRKLERLGGGGVIPSTSYSLHCHHQNDFAARWVSHFNVLLFVRAKSQDSVHELQL